MTGGCSAFLLACGGTVTVMARSSFWMMTICLPVGGMSVWQNAGAGVLKMPVPVMWFTVRSKKAAGITSGFLLHCLTGLFRPCVQAITCLWTLPLRPELQPVERSECVAENS